MRRSAQREVVYAWDTFYSVPCPTAGYPLVSAVAEEQARCMLDTLLAEHGLATSAVVRARSVQGAAASVRVDAAAGADLPLRSRHRRRR